MPPKPYCPVVITHSAAGTQVPINIKCRTFRPEGVCQLLQNDTDPRVETSCIRVFIDSYVPAQYVITTGSFNTTTSLYTASTVLTDTHTGQLTRACDSCSETMRSVLLRNLAIRRSQMSFTSALTSSAPGMSSAALHTQSRKEGR